MKTTKRTVGWLVMAAARRTATAAMMAAVLIMGMTACASGDDSVTQEKPTPQQPTAQTATKIHVTVGAGITDDDGQTRSTVDYNTSTGKRTLKFTTGDCLYIDRDLDGGTKNLAGTLTMVGEPTDGGTSATFEGDVTVYKSDGSATDYNFGSEDPLTGSTATLWHKDLTPGLITLNADKSQAYHQDVLTAVADVETLMTTMLLVQGGYTQGTGYQLSAASMTQPIVNCAILGLTADDTYQVDYLSGATEAMTDAVKTLATGMTATGGTIAFAFIAKTGSLYHGIRLTNTANPSDTHTLALGQNTFAAKVYNVSRYWTGTTFVKPVDLSKLSGNYEAKNGDVLTGTLGGKYKITIAAGATVTLCNATIPGYDKDDNFRWSGITCLGNATITLVGTNIVKGYHYSCAGIEPGESGTTLTIQGNGSLTVATCATDEQGRGAGIGSKQSGQEVGNIVITGGDITAKSGDAGAGIGSGQESRCGDITIRGGTVTAIVDGHYFGAGIGCGDLGNCGNITITGGTVNATGGRFGAGIGSGNSMSSCGNITISGGSVTATSENAAGIGSGRGNSDRSKSSCGNITITGGTINATGHEKGAGIGSAEYGSCGNITISGTAAGSATRGSNATYDIGAGEGGTCGDISVTASNFSGTFDPAYAVPIVTFFNSTISFSTRFTQWPEGSQQPTDDISNPHVVSITITSSRNSQSVTVSPSSGNDFTNGTAGSFSLIVADGDVLTFTATDVDYEYQYMNDKDTFVGTCTVSGAGTTINLGTVLLRKQ